jgi:hypothetical protein
LVVLVLSACAAIVTALQQYMVGADKLDWGHFAAAAFVALFSWASRSPWDVDKRDASRVAKDAAAVGRIPDPVDWKRKGGR